MEAIFKYRLWRDEAGSLQEGAWGSIGLPRRQAAMEEEYTSCAIPSDVGPDRLLGMEQSNRTAQLSVKDSSRTLVLSEVRVMGQEHPTAVSPLLSAEQEPWVSCSLRKRGVSSERAIWKASVASQLTE